MEDATNDLGYIHPTGIEVRTYFQNDGASGWIEFAYGVNPHLLDRLLGYHRNSRTASEDYYEFVQRHVVRRKLKAKAYTATSEFTDCHRPGCIPATTVSTCHHDLLPQLHKATRQRE